MDWDSETVDLDIGDLPRSLRVQRFGPIAQRGANTYTIGEIGGTVLKFRAPVPDLRRDGGRRVKNRLSAGFRERSGPRTR
jgi:hypothetical protein